MAAAAAPRGAQTSNVMSLQNAASMSSTPDAVGAAVQQRDQGDARPPSRHLRDHLVEVATAGGRDPAVGGGSA